MHNPDSRDEPIAPASITSGPASCIDTGIVTAYLGHPIRLDWATLPSIEFRFVRDDTLDDVAVTIGGDDPEVLEFRCANFDRPDGRGTAEPVRVHDDDLGSYHLHFRVFLHGRTADHTLHYTLWREPHPEPEPEAPLVS